MWHDCQPNQYFQVVFKMRILKLLQKIRISFVSKERNYHVLNLLSSLNKFCVWSVKCSRNVFLLCQRTISVVPYLVRINIDSFGVIILLQARCRKKSIFPVFSKWKLGQVAYILNYMYKSAPHKLNWLKFGQLSAR